MKQKDISTLVVIAIISAVLSFILSGVFISSEQDRNLKAEIVTPISSQFNQPPPQYFNSSATNPTTLIQIGEESNTAPFGQ